MTTLSAGLATPHPLGSTLPPLYHSDDFAQQLCAAFDDVLAPIFAILDCFPAYLDAGTAPEDMLDWLAGWIGLTLTDQGGAARKRDSIAIGAAVLPERAPRAASERRSGLRSTSRPKSWNRVRRHCPSPRTPRHRVRRFPICWSWLSAMSRMPLTVAVSTR